MSTENVLIINQPESVNTQIEYEDSSYLFGFNDNDIFKIDAKKLYKVCDDAQDNKENIEEVNNKLDNTIIDLNQTKENLNIVANNLNNKIRYGRSLPTGIELQNYQDGDIFCLIIE